MIDIQTLFAKFLNNLESITDDELLAELEKARIDCQDSYLLDGNEDGSDLVFKNADISPVIAITDSALYTGRTQTFTQSGESTDTKRTGTSVFEHEISISTSYSYCTEFEVAVGATRFWAEGDNAA